MIFFYNKTSRQFWIKNASQEGPLWFDHPSLFKGITEEYIGITNLECCYIKDEEDTDSLFFVPSSNYDFFVYETSDNVTVATSIDEILYHVDIDLVKLTPNRLAQASVLTFGQVPRGMTLYNEIFSFKAPYFGIFDQELGTFLIKQKEYQADDRLLDKDFFLEYYRNKLNTIGDYSLFYSAGVDSEFIKFCKPDAELLSFDYIEAGSTVSHRDLYSIFKRLDHIDVHTLNFPAEKEVWDTGRHKVVTGFGGDASFATSDIRYCDFGLFIGGSGGPASWPDKPATKEDMELIKSFTSAERTYLSKRKLCGGDCSQNTIQWAWKTSNSLVHNVLDDLVVAATFKKFDNNYSNRFLLNFVKGGKNTNRMYSEWWEPFEDFTKSYITTDVMSSYHSLKQSMSAAEQERSFLFFRLVYLLELYYSSKKSVIEEGT